MIEYELSKMGVSFEKTELIREIDGVTVVRVYEADKSHVLKCFDKPEYRREISNYALLNSCGIPTLKIHTQTDRAILMEDISCSEKFRLGEKCDMEDPVIARALADWYKKLHAAQTDLSGMYDESDYFTRENIEIIKEKLSMQDCPVWKYLEDSFDEIRKRLNSLHRVIAYNDFYYTNLIVARDKSSAFMFDYNLLGRGYALSDVRNVTYSLSHDAAQAFLDAYGPLNPMEQLVDDVVSPIVTLYMACQREKFPMWGNEALETVKTDLAERITRLIGA